MAYEMRMSDWSSDVCSSDLLAMARPRILLALRRSLAMFGDGERTDVGKRLTRPRTEPEIMIEEEIRRHHDPEHAAARLQIGRASRRESVWQYVEISVVAVQLKKNQQLIINKHPIILY